MHPRRDSQNHPGSLLSPLTSWMATKLCPVLRKTQREVWGQPQRMEVLDASQAKHSWAAGRGFLCQVPRLDGDVRWTQWRGKAAGKVPPCQSQGFFLLEFFLISILAPLSWISSMGYTSGSAHQVIKNIHLKNSKNKQTRNHSNLITQDCTEVTSYSHREALIHSLPPWVWYKGKSSSPCRRLLFQFF